MPVASLRTSVRIAYATNRGKSCTKGLGEPRNARFRRLIAQELRQKRRNWHKHFELRHYLRALRSG